MNQENNLYKEQKKLVLVRFKTLNPDSKIMFGSNKELSVNEIIKHIEKDTDFGIDVIKVQIKMLRILATGN